MTTKNKITVFVVLLLFGGGGWYWYIQKQANTPQITLSNKNQAAKTVDYTMSYKGQTVTGPAEFGAMYMETLKGITFQFDSLTEGVVMGSSDVQILDNTLAKASDYLVFTIYDNVNEKIEKEKKVTFA